MAVYNLPVKLVLEVMLVNMKGATLSSNKIILKSHYNKWKNNKMLHLLDYKNNVMCNKRVFYKLFIC